MKVVDATKTIVELLLRADQVVHIARAVVPAGVAGAAIFDGTALAAEAGGFDVDSSVASEKSSVTRYACGKNSIEHIHAQADTDYQVFWRSDAK